jgi:hypothetical protein
LYEKVRPKSALTHLLTSVEIASSRSLLAMTDVGLGVVAQPGDGSLAMTDVDLVGVVATPWLTTKDIGGDRFVAGALLAMTDVDLVGAAGRAVGHSQ